MGETRTLPSFLLRGISLHDDMILTVRGVAPQALDSDGGGWSADLRAGMKTE